MLGLKAFRLAGVTGVSLALMAIPASANISNLIVNPNFFDGSAPYAGSYDGSVTGTTIPDWTVTAGAVDWIGSYWQAPVVGGGYPGGSSVDLDGLNSAGAISQTVNTTANSFYTLSFYLGANPDGPPDPKNLLVSVTNANPDSTSFNPVYPPSIEDGLAGWTLETFVFEANGSSSTISFASLDTLAETLNNANGVSFGPVIAGVSLTSQGGSQEAATPEPGLYTVLGLGLAGLAFFIRRRFAA